ncbi:LIM domain-containing protein WLIM2b-like [Ipomoea triloba]|uniref:LIM domain-containing protein WLIM2b-like n=1 Tax=Ipomoea triloba TaxID=35885 RepID=UPI00125D9D7F|nr:LIM domain-containing protein WLIM2b-like [Ipomoea triloba]
MSAYNSGTPQKCKACDKTVYIAEMVAPGGVAYHNTCFRCTHCNGRLSLSNYSSKEGVLYCKPHFEQILKEKGVSVRSQSFGKQAELTRTPSKLSSMFSGTQDKCAACKKTVYPLEKVTVDGDFYHQNCFKCAHGGCKLTTSSYAALDGLLYCKPHFSQLFKEKGCYNHLTKSTSRKNSAALQLAAEAELAKAQSPRNAAQDVAADQ